MCNTEITGIKTHPLTPTSVVQPPNRSFVQQIYVITLSCLALQCIALHCAFCVQASRAMQRVCRSIIENVYDKVEHRDHDC